MHITNITVAFKGEYFKITQSFITAGEFLKLHKTITEDILFISLHQRDLCDKKHSPIVVYHIYDTRVKKDLYGDYTLITTNTSGKKIMDMLTITNSSTLNTLGLILRRNPKKIALVLKKIEQEYVHYYGDEKSMFTSHPDNNMFHFGLPLLLGLKGVEDRQPEHT